MRWVRWSVVCAVMLASACSPGKNGNGVASSESCVDPFMGAGQLRFKTEGWKTNFCKHSVPYKEFMSGGPPRDGIPPIDAPKFVSVAHGVRWIHDREPVIHLRVGDESRIYPLQILIWHEIVNDTVGGKPVAVTFCPLCYAAVSFVRPTIRGKTLTFGTTGNLRKSDLVMWDRQTESWWQQFTGTAIVGELTGTKLEILASSIVSWKHARTAYPSAKVLSRDTGQRRAYGANPYVGYDDVNKKPFLYRGRVGKGLAPMERVVGVELGKGRAYHLDDVRKRQAVNDTIGGTALVVLWSAGTASAMDKRIISEGKDLGAVGVFARQLDGKLLTFDAHGSGFRDRETASTWNVLGVATAGPLRGKRLRAIAHHNIFWFVWSAFVPGGGLWRP